MFFSLEGQMLQTFRKKVTTENIKGNNKPNLYLYTLDILCKRLKYLENGYNGNRKYI